MSKPTRREFRKAVSVSGDVAIGGAFGDDDKGRNSGSEYIFHRRPPTQIGLPR